MLFCDVQMSAVRACVTTLCVRMAGPATPSLGIPQSVSVHWVSMATCVNWVCAWSFHFELVPLYSELALPQNKKRKVINLRI
jgi:hypothetical protein